MRIILTHTKVETLTSTRVLRRGRGVYEHIYLDTAVLSLSIASESVLVPVLLHDLGLLRTFSLVDAIG